MNDFFNWLNQNQGVLAAIPIAGAGILWIIRRIKKSPKQKPKKHKSQSVVVIGSHNYIEGQTTDIETEIELSPQSNYVGEPKGSRVIAKINSSKNRITSDCFLLDCFGENFLLSLKDFKGEHDKTPKKTKASSKLAVAILKKFYGYSPHNQAIIFNRSFYSVLANELMGKNIVLEIQTIEEAILKLPFHLLSESDFSVTHHCLSVNLTKSI